MHIILKTFTLKVGRLLTRLRFLRTLKKNAKSGDFAELRWICFRLSMYCVGTDCKSAFTLYLIKNTKFIQRKAEVNYQIRQAYDLYRALVLCLLLESR